MARPRKIEGLSVEWEEKGGYPVSIVEDVFAEENTALIELLRTLTGRDNPRVMLVADSNVVQRIPGIGTRIGKYVQTHGITLAGAPAVVGGGEKAKGDNLASVYRVIDAAVEAKIGAGDVMLALGGSAVNLFIAMALSSMPQFCRLARSAMLSVVDQEFVEAARAYGSGNIRIIFQEVLPNALGPIIVQTTQSIAGKILTAASLSFIGMGVQAPQPEWGTMLSEARPYMRECPYLVLIPGIFIIVTALSFNLFGDGLRDALDPHMKN